MNETYNKKKRDEENFVKKSAVKNFWNGCRQLEIEKYPSIPTKKVLTFRSPGNHTDSWAQINPLNS